MPFTFKLSKRLACSRRAGTLVALAAALASVLSCEPGKPLSIVTIINSLVVRPDSIILDANNSAQFRAFGRTSNGDSVPVSVTWAASQGTITSSGLYTADSSDSDVTITATALSSSELTSTAGVTKGGRLAKVILTPATTALPAGATTQFAAYGLRNNGSSTSVNVVFSATGGTISPSGLYQAGRMAGAYRVTGLERRTNLAGTSPVSVMAVASVASATVLPATANVGVGATVQLTASLKDSVGNPLSGRDVTWTSSNAAIAQVNTNGQVTTLAPGSATVSATSEGKTGTASVTATPPAPAPVATVTVTPATATLQSGSTVQLTASTRDANGNTLTGRTITWTSGNPSVATISGSGLVTGVTTGTVTLAATSEGQSGSAAVTVNASPPPPPAAVATVAVSPASTTVNLGQTAQFTATLRDASNNVLTGRGVSWASSNTAVATVNANGLATTLVAGTATITATSEGQGGQAQLTVNAPPPPPPAPVATVVVSPASTTVNVGQTGQFTTTLRDASNNVLTGRVVTWSSSNTGVATVNAAGLATALTAGSTTISATSEGSVGQAAVTVSAAAAPGMVTNLVLVSATDSSMVLSFTEVDDGTGQPAGYDIRFGVAPSAWWQSSSVSQGTCTVPVAGTSIGATRACSILGLSPSTSYNVQIAAFRGTFNVSAVFGALSAQLTAATPAAPQAPVATVTVAPASTSVSVGQTAQFTAALRDASNNVLTGRVVTWASSNTAVATVNASGLATAAGSGSATITATSEGRSGQAQITVTTPPPPAPVATVTVAPASVSVNVGQTAQFTTTLRDASNNVLTGRTVTWSSSNTAIATVNGTGLATAVVAGTATITATSEGRSGQAQITVNTPPPPPPSGEPTDPGSGYLFSDDFDRYASVIAMYSPGNCPAGTDGYGVPEAYATYGVRTRPDMAGARPCNVRAGYSLVTGRGGSGKAVSNHFVADLSNTQVNNFIWTGNWGSQAVTQNFSYSGAIVLQIWFKGTGPGYCWYCKGFEMWYMNGTHGRIQLGVGGNHHWHFNPNTGEVAYQPVGPYPATVQTDNQWHRMTILYRPNTSGGFGSSSSRDGRAAAWIDGTKVVDLSAATCGVTPPGGTKQWCNASELDLLGSVALNDRIAFARFPDLANGTNGDFDLAFDDYKVWSMP